MPVRSRSEDPLTLRMGVGRRPVIKRFMVSKLLSTPCIHRFRFGGSQEKARESRREGQRGGKRGQERARESE